MKRIKNADSLKIKKIVRSVFPLALVGMMLGMTACSQTQDISGEITSDYTVDVPRDDFLEIRMEGNRANLMNPMSGGADSEAETLRSTILEAEDKMSIKGKIYYISTSGDDMNDGLSKETPFRTLEVLKWLKLSEGDAVLFERGSVFRITEPVALLSGVTYAAYGEGEKPCIYGSPKNYADSSLWSPSRMKNVWKIDFGYDDAGNIVFNHGEYVGIKKLSGLNQLANTGDFYHNETDGIIYLYCAEGNPGNCYQDIEISPHISMFHMDTTVSNVTIDNLCMKYSGGFAISGARANNGISITNCEIGYIGGSKLNLNTRYGNAIQFWSGTQNTVVKNNWIYQIFDTAVTFQGNSNHEYSNITFSDNLFEYNDMDIEIWDDGKEFTIKGLSIENNIMRFNSHGWGTRQTDSGNRGGAACFKFSLDNCAYYAGVIKNNIFDCPRYNAVFYITSTDGDFRTDISDNTIYLNDNRENNRVMRCGDMIDNKAPEQIEADNLGQLEAAFKKFDQNPKKVEWLKQN